MTPKICLDVVPAHPQKIDVVPAHPQKLAKVLDVVPAHPQKLAPSHRLDRNTEAVDGYIGTQYQKHMITHVPYKVPRVILIEALAQPQYTPEPTLIPDDPDNAIANLFFWGAFADKNTS
jgi:hypothetical protein